MPEYNFTLILTGNVDEHLDELFDAGANDALFGEIDSVAYAEFDRDADTLSDAVLSAVAQIESVDDIQVTHIEPDDLVTVAEIAQRLERSRESVRLLIAGRRGPGNFPPPVSHIRDRSRLWRWSDVAAWAERDTTAPNLVAALNAALDLRAHTARLAASDRADFHARLSEILEEDREVLERLAR